MKQLHIEMKVLIVLLLNTKILFKELCCKDIVYYSRLLLFFALETNQRQCNIKTKLPA